MANKKFHVSVRLSFYSFLEGFVVEAENREILSVSWLTNFTSHSTFITDNSNDIFFINMVNEVIKSNIMSKILMFDDEDIKVSRC